MSEVRAQREAILAIASRHGARNVRLFGSTARGTARMDSDVDLLVDLEPGRTLMDLGGLLVEMEDVLGRPIDVATDRILRPEYRVQVLMDAIPL